MKLILSIFILIFAANCLDRDSLIGRITLGLAGIVILLSVASLIFSIVGTLASIFIIVLFIMFVAGLFRRQC